MSVKSKLSAVLAGAVMLAMVPFGAFAGDTAADPVYDEQNDVFFANGTSIVIDEPTTEGKSATITWEGGSVEIDADDTVYGGSDCSMANANLDSTNIVMNGGTVNIIVGGHKTKNEKDGCEYSKVGTATLDINGGTITKGLYGIDNQNTAFGNDVMINGLYKNYAIENLLVTIDGAKVNDFRGVTSYAYAGNILVCVGMDEEATLGSFYWGTNGVIGNATLNMYSGTVKLSNSILRSIVQGKMVYNLYGGSTDVIYAGSYYSYEETFEGAGGDGSWWTTNVGNVDYGFANKTEVNIQEGVTFQDIVLGFQYRAEDVAKFKELYPDQLWRIEGMNTDATVTVRTESAPTNPSGEYSVFNTDLGCVIVEEMSPTVEIEQDMLSINVGETAKMDISTNGVFGGGVLFTNPNPDVLYLQNDGTVTGLAAGVVEITVTRGSAKDTCLVFVVDVNQEGEATIDPTKPVDKVQVGVSADVAGQIGQLVNQTIKDSINSDTQLPGMDTATAENVVNAVLNGHEIVPVVESTTLDKVAAQEQQAIKELVGKDTVAAYIDLSVVLYADGAKLGNVTQLASPVAFTVAIPEGLAKEGRTFYVVRLHNGVAQKLDTVQNADGTLTFSTDRFSTYAIAYTDTASTDSPSTGDNVDVMPIATALALGAAGVVVLAGKRKKDR